MELHRQIYDAERLAGILTRTERALERQGSVPSSPGVLFDGKPYLCAGAMFVKEALAVTHSAKVATCFERQVMLRDSEFICAVGAEIGLDVAQVKARIAENDDLPPGDRLLGMIAKFRLLRSLLGHQHAG